MPAQLKIKISTAGAGKPFIKQLRSFSYTWDNCQFFINEEIPECDLWVVYGGLGKQESTLCSPDKTLFITNEPPSVKIYQNKFLKQFGAIITCHKNIRHPNVIFNQQALPWWVGHKVYADSRDDTEYSKTYDELKSMRPIQKTKLLSVIVSNKTFTRGHEERLVFMEKLTEALGSDIDVFGFGSNTIEDKWDAIAPYKYHIVLENSAYYNYWTEKLADAFLGQSYPIYYGCPNIYDYFSPSALSIIDINNPENAIDVIKKIITSKKYESSVKDVEIAKNLILDKYQIFPMLCEYANTYRAQRDKIYLTLKPEQATVQQIVRKMLRVLLVILKKLYGK
jgi:hypothetical protein